MPETQTTLDSTAPTQWPPLAHITQGPTVNEGQLALCGAKLMGIKLDDASEVCEECVRIAQRGEADA